MDPIILDFAVGIAIGSISELLFLRRSARKNHSHKPVQRTRPVNDLRSVPSSTKTLKASHVSIARPLSESKPRVVAEPDRVQRSVPYSEPPQSSCPTCGLRAPEKLMAEHLLGSPLHRKRAPAPVAPPTPPAKPSASRISLLEEEDSRESMRNLLQMLVPPRAFGRRHGQRTDQVAQLVQTLD